MTLKNNAVFPEIRRGRRKIYSFDKLAPGQKLIIPGNSNLFKQRLSVAAALNKYKKQNSFNWTTVVIVEAGNIAAYRRD